MLDDRVTSPTLLRRIGNRDDHAAWVEFVDRYKPLVVAYIRRLPLSHDEIDEVCQRVWIHLAERMASFQYDPSRTFRGWLRKLCASRAIDLIRTRESHRAESIVAEPFMVADPSEVDDSQYAGRPRLLIEAERVQEIVRKKVGEKAWNAFWLKAVEGHSIREVADALGMTYAATYIAQKRVGLKLRAEGERGIEGAG